MSQKRRSFIELARNTHGYHARSGLVQECWPELLAVVEAAKTHACESSPETCDLIEALENLDSKVEL